MQTLQHQHKGECAQQANMHNQEQQTQHPTPQTTCVHMQERTTVTHEFANEDKSHHVCEKQSNVWPDQPHQKQIPHAHNRAFQCRQLPRQYQQ